MTDTPRRPGARARVIRLHEDDGAFDREFWGGIPAGERVEMLWQMSRTGRSGEASNRMNSDSRDLFAALNAAGARYLVVGGYTLALHAEPRFTKDLDVWIDRSPGNARAVWNALAAFGAPLSDVSPDDLASADLIYQLGVPPNRIALLTSIDGVVLDAAWPRRVEQPYGDQPARFLSLEDLIANKRASGRPQDLLDLELLERHRR